MQPPDPKTPANARLDGLFGGRLRLWQVPGGHRAGTDAVLLAASCPPAASIADLGAGVGTIGLRAAQMHDDARVTLIERDDGAAALCARNIAENGLSRRVELVHADVLTSAFRGLEARCDVVLSNPPFDEPGRVRASPDARRAAAHVLQQGAGADVSHAPAGLDGWLRAAIKCLTPQGRLVLVHRAEALPRLLAAMQGRFGAIAVRPVLPRAGEAASRVLICAKRGSKAPFRLLPALVLHGEDGAFTREAEAIHRGERLLPFDQHTR